VLVSVTKGEIVVGRDRSLAELHRGEALLLRPGEVAAYRAAVEPTEVAELWLWPDFEAPSSWLPRSGELEAEQFDLSIYRLSSTDPPQ
jgi:hypothetical protein